MSWVRAMRSRIVAAMLAVLFEEGRLVAVSADVVMKEERSNFGTRQLLV